MPSNSNRWNDSQMAGRERERELVPLNLNSLPSIGLTNIVSLSLSLSLSLSWLMLMWWHSVDCQDRPSDSHHTVSVSQWSVVLWWLRCRCSVNCQECLAGLLSSPPAACSGRPETTDSYSGASCGQTILGNYLSNEVKLDWQSYKLRCERREEGDMFLCDVWDWETGRLGDCESAGSGDLTK